MQRHVLAFQKDNKKRDLAPLSQGAQVHTEHAHQVLARPNSPFPFPPNANHTG